MMGRGLVVVGYSGNDNSIMNFIEDNIDDSAFLSKGLYWTVIRDGNVSQRVENLILKAREKVRLQKLLKQTVLMIYCMILINARDCLAR